MTLSRNTKGVAVPSISLLTSKGYLRVRVACECSREDVR